MNRNRRDGHHPLHDRVSWSKWRESRALRESIIIDMNRGVHEDLHANTPAVPVLGYHALCRTLRNYRPGGEGLEPLDNLLFAIEESLLHPRTHRLERQLGLLVIEGIEVQRPFIKEGIVTPERRVLV